MNETLDHFLDGRVKLLQPAEGYRAGIDPLFLAAAVHATPGQKILDVGAGIGSASLFLAKRAEDVTVTGLEIQEELVHLAAMNIKENELEDRVNVLSGDILFPPESLKANSFDQVITNPPFYEVLRARSSPNPVRAQSNVESTKLEKWIKACIKLLKPKGIFTMIHRTERLPDILHFFRNRIGNIVLYPLWPSNDKPARRFLIQGKKGAKGEMRLSSGLVLHGKSEKYTPEAEAILRHAKPIQL